MEKQVLVAEQKMLTVFIKPIEGNKKEFRVGTPTRVVLADDHDIVRQGLKRLLDRVPEIEVVGEASDGLQALRFVQELKPDVLLLDIEMPMMDGIEVTRRIREAKIDVRILILSAYDDREYIRSLFDMGVSGYLVKGGDAGQIIEAVRGVAKDQKGWVSPQVKNKLDKMQDSYYKQNTLTFRDLELLRLLSDGKSDEEIARQFSADKNHVLRMIKTLMQKLGVSSIEQAVKMAKQEGWIH